MKRIAFIGALMFLGAVTVAWSADEAPAPADAPADAAVKLLERLMPALGGDDLGARSKAQNELEKAVHAAAAPGQETQRPALAKALCDRLGSDTPIEARVWLLRMLQHVGREESVSPVAALLADKEPRVRECARRALTANTSEPAGQALRDALAKAATDEWRIALMNSAGYRRDGQAVAGIAESLCDPNPHVGAAAAAALGKIATPDAAKVLGDRLDQVNKLVRPGVIDSHLLCADAMLAAGKKDAAGEIYEKIYAGDRPAKIRIAALRGLLGARPAKAVPLVMAQLKGDDPALRAAVVAFVREVPGPEATRAFAAEVEKLPPPSAAMLLGALAKRGDPAAAPAVAKAAGSDNAEVRLAALKALADVGAAEHVPLLARAAAGDDRAAAGAAAAGLARLAGKGVDKAILALADTSDPPVKAACLTALGDRHYAPAASFLLQAGKTGPPAVRKAALASLGRLAGKEHLAELVALLKPADQTTRSEAEKALVGTCSRIEDKDACAAAVLAGLGDAPAEAKVALVGLLKHVPTDKALAGALAAAKDANADVRTAAVRTLADWPSPAPADELLAVARSDAPAVQQVLALRGYVRMIAMGNRKGDEAVRMCADAMAAAKRPEEKKLVLAALAETPSIEAMTLAEKHLDEPATAAEAGMAVAKTAAAISGAHKDRALAACRKLVETAKAESVRKQAQENIDFIQRYDDYITAWLASGPYRQKDKSGSALLDAPLPPETDPAKAEWKPAKTDPKDPWKVDLGPYGDNFAIYLAARITSPDAREVSLEIGSDDGVKAWLNGKLVHSNNASRGLKPGEDKVKVALDKGGNELLLKIDNNSGPSGACARIRAIPDGKAEGLKLEPAEPTRPVSMRAPPPRHEAFPAPALAFVATPPIAAMADAPATAPAKRDDSAAETLGFKLGLQAYTYRKFTFFETVDRAAELGIKYIEMYPGQALSKDRPKARTDHRMGPADRAAVKRKLADAGVKLVCYGVVGTDGSVMAFAKDMGIEIIVTETKPNAELDKLLAEGGLKMALHNHPKSWPPDEVLKACEGRSERVGACGDTGHWMRAGLKPVDTLKKLQGRLVSVHLKDIPKIGGGDDVVWGTGAGDVKGMLAELKRQGWTGYIVAEYESKPSDPTADVRRCVAYFDRVAEELAD